MAHLLSPGQNQDMLTPTHATFTPSSPEGYYPNPSPVTPTPSVVPVLLADHPSTPTYQPAHHQHHSQVAPSPYLPRTTSDPSFDSPLLHSQPAPSRTVAILLPHAHQHQLAIRKRFAEAGIEVIDEYDWDADPNVLENDLGLDGRMTRAVMDELDGDHQHEHGVGERKRKAAHIWLLERKRVVEVMHALLGNESIERAKYAAPTSLRALYGSSPHGLVLWTPSSLPQADPLIQLFFPDVGPIGVQPGSPTDSNYDQNVPAGDQDLDFTSPETEAFVATPTEADVASFPPGVVGLGIRDRTSSTGSSSFKARPTPSSTHQPERVVRQSRASMLRQGADPSTFNARSPSSGPADFTLTPGHKRTGLAVDVASTRPPQFAVRPSRASLIRQGSDVPPQRVKREPSSDDQFYEQTPGHKRTISIDVASTKDPVIKPRQSRASMLRAGGDIVAPRKSVASKTGEEIRLERKAEEAIKRERRRSEMPQGAKSVGVASMAPPSFTPRQTKASLLRTGGAVAAPPTDGRPGLSHRRSSSSFVSATHTSSMRSNSSYNPNSSARPSSVTAGRRQPLGASTFDAPNVDPSHAPAPPSLSRVASTQPPTVAPRANRAQLLRQGQAPPPPPVRAASAMARSEDYNPFASTPGHKRRESIAVASTAKPPDIVPRANRASLLKAGGPLPLPPATMGRTRPASSIGIASHGTKTNVDRPSSSTTIEDMLPPTLKRRESLTSSAAPPSITPRLNRAATLRTGEKSLPPSAFNRSYSSSSARPESAQSTASTTTAKREPVAVRPPSIEPRPNRAQELRLAKRASMSMMSGGGGDKRGSGF